MKKVLCSFGFNDHSKLLSIAIPTFYLYANNHNYDMFIPSLDYLNDLTKSRHPSWWKIEVITKLFNIYDQVLWIDSDIIICQFDKDIFDDIPENSDMGLVVHHTKDGYVPNCGVWALNKSCLKWFNSLWQHNNFARSNCWWEQAAMLYLLGIDPDQKIISSLPEKFDISWKSLDYLWNPHINDERKIPEKTRFFHSTGFQDRYAVMKNILKQINI